MPARMAYAGYKERAEAASRPKAIRHNALRTLTRIGNARVVANGQPLNAFRSCFGNAPVASKTEMADGNTGALSTTAKARRSFGPQAARKFRLTQITEEGLDRSAATASTRPQPRSASSAENTGPESQ